MPKLRHVRFTDFRSLRKDSESYDACCQRLFCDTLEPCIFSGAHDELLTVFLSDLAAAAPNGRIESFVVGSHPFERRKQLLEGEK